MEISPGLLWVDPDIDQTRVGRPLKILSSQALLGGVLLFQNFATQAGSAIKLPKNFYLSSHQLGTREVLGMTVL